MMPIRPSQGDPRHDPVMLREVLSALALNAGDTVVDGTLGLSGHARAFAEAISPGGTLLGIDWDQEMLEIGRQRLSEVEDVEKHFCHSDYRQIAEIVRRHKLVPNGILLDLGLNSAQIDDPSRGIAFSKDGPLDMRMDRSRGEPASALLNRLGPTEIENILFKYGDERWGKAIGKKIVEIRKAHPLRTTHDLVEAVLAAVPPGARDKRIHPATRTFQAVRIAVNSELEGIDDTLMEAARCLAPGGTLVVLSYHSGEDRQAKHAFRELADSGGYLDLFKKPLQPTPDEISRNPRSRSAKLRAIRRFLT
ncbi:MAG: 16S rRNA (cytosine(1402)-N(4))-methyltransferase RsmH [Fimbriimonas sp.]|nr:16S rRNA (cytosine(1402)-N(4))-methyltransferase RsmH [Fimbriimonas sp.]